MSASAMIRTVKSLSRIQSLFSGLARRRSVHNDSILTSLNEGEREREREREREGGTNSFLVRRFCTETQTIYFSLLSTENWAFLRDFRSPYFQRWRWISSGSYCRNLYLHDGQHGNYLRWTPSTNEFEVVPPFKRLPLLHRRSSHVDIRFSHRSRLDSDPECKVVRFACHYYVDAGGKFVQDYYLQFELFSRQHISWKEIFDVPYDWVYLNDRYYWRSSDKPQRHVTTIDFTTHQISLLMLQSKVGKLDRRTYHSKLVEYDGKLGLMKYSRAGTDRTFAIWLLQDENDYRSWTREFEINIVDGWTPPLLFSSDRRFLFVEGRSHELTVYDLRTGEVKNLGNHYACESTTVVEVIS